MKTIHSLTLGFFLIASSLGAKTGSTKPNVLLIAIDDLNDWVGFLGGHSQANTPHMDALAKRGRNFTNAHCSVPVCTASRLSVVSGVSPTTHGSYEFGPRYEELPALMTAPTIHRYFKDRGYYVLSGGKILHHGFNGRLKNDLDRWLGREKNKKSEMPINRPKDWSGAWDWGMYPENDLQMADLRLAVKAANVLKEDFDQPFMMTVGFFRPHVPLLVPSKWFDLYEVDSLELPSSGASDLDDLPPNFLNINEYAVAPTHAEVIKNDSWRSLTHAYLASVSFVDHCVGIVMDALDFSEYAENTIIVLWSDHGFHLGEKQHWAKRTLWEESTRVPLLFVGPGIEPGKPCVESVSLLDLYPTLVDLCNLPENPRLEGISLVPQLNDPATQRHQPAITSSYFGNHSVRSKYWRLISYENGSKELYDHRNDPGEYNNLADDSSHQKIKEALVQWVPKNTAPEFKARSERR